ncbi:MAG: site-specific DNA-methyltransferase [Mariniphaga sp.]|nr:site-specific DNA-methyltransferase [Mariniphaga sp.]
MILNENGSIDKLIINTEKSEVYNIDCLEGLKNLPDNCVDIVVTSPPYWGQRGDDGIGLEINPKDYVNNLTAIFLDVMRVLKEDGVFWLNIGDAYNTPINWNFDDHIYSSLGKDKNGLDPNNSAYTKKRGNRRACIEKESGWLQYGNLLALPWRIILNLCDKGYFYRGEVIWAKRKAMPEGCCRRPHRKHEMIYIITKSEKHNFTTKPPIPSVWDLKADPFIKEKGNHTSTFPLDLPLTCIESSGIDEGIVLDPFMGTGTTALAAMMKGLNFIGFELDNENFKTCQNRIRKFKTEKAQMLF